jgi:hypothetical protein
VVAAVVTVAAVVVVAAVTVVVAAAAAAVRAGVPLVTAASRVPAGPGARHPFRAWLSQPAHSMDPQIINPQAPAVPPGWSRRYQQHRQHRQHRQPAGRRG